MDGERRDAERLPILGALRGEVLVSQPMAVVEIGPAGATIETTFPLHIGSIHELTITLDQMTIVTSARIIHSRITDVDQDVVRYQSGVELLQLSAEAAQALSGYVTTATASRAGLSDPAI